MISLPRSGEEKLACPHNHTFTHLLWKLYAHHTNILTRTCPPAMRIQVDAGIEALEENPDQKLIYVLEKFRLDLGARTAPVSSSL